MYSSHNREVNQDGLCIQVIIEKLINQSISKSSNQSINQSINQPTNQTTNQSIMNQSIDQLIYQSINQPTNQSINQSISQLINHSYDRKLIQSRPFLEQRTCSVRQGKECRRYRPLNSIFYGSHVTQSNLLQEVPEAPMAGAQLWRSSDLNQISVDLDNKPLL